MHAMKEIEKHSNHLPSLLILCSTTTSWMSGVCMICQWNLHSYRLSCHLSWDNFDLPSLTNDSHVLKVAEQRSSGCFILNFRNVDSVTVPDHLGRHSGYFTGVPQGSVSAPLLFWFWSDVAYLIAYSEQRSLCHATVTRDAPNTTFNTKAAFHHSWVCLWMTRALCVLVHHRALCVWTLFHWRLMIESCDTSGFTNLHSWLKTWSSHWQ